MQDVLFPDNSTVILILHIFLLGIYSSYENSHFASCILNINDFPLWISVFLSIFLIKKLSDDFDFFFEKYTSEFIVVFSHDYESIAKCILSSYFNVFIKLR